MKDLTEKKLSSQVVFTGKMLSVKRDTVELPNGKDATREFILHPGASVMVPLFPDNKIILVRQFRYAVGKEFLELPAGKLDFGETPLETAKRELVEETGFYGENFELIGEFFPCIGYADEKMFLYIVTNLKKSQKNTDSDEFLENVILDFDEAVSLVLEGKINDTKTMLSLLLAEKFLKK